MRDWDTNAKVYSHFRNNECNCPDSEADGDPGQPSRPRMRCQMSGGDTIATEPRPRAVRVYSTYTRRYTYNRTNTW